MSHKDNLRNWCGDLAVLIPDEIADELGLTEGTYVTLSLDSDGLSIRKQTSLGKTVETIDPDDQSENVETDSTQENEI